MFYVDARMSFPLTALLLCGVLRPLQSHAASRDSHVAEVNKITPKVQNIHATAETPVYAKLHTARHRIQG